MTEPHAGFVEIQKRVFREDMAIAGTPFGLHYTSWRMPGNHAAYELVLPLYGVDTNFDRIQLDISVAGNQATYGDAAPLTDPLYFFEWDGLDSEEQSTEGVYKARLDYSYFYSSLVYSGSGSSGFPPGPSGSKSFTVGGGSSGGGGGSTGPLTCVPAGNNSGGSYYVVGGSTAEPYNPIYTEMAPAPKPRVDYFTQITKIGVAMAEKQGLGGWTLTPNHFYDARGEVLFKGDGSMRDAEPVGTPACVFEEDMDEEPEGTNWVTVVSEDGSMLYVFDADGFHLQTLDSITGREIYSFGYDTNQWLTSITDSDGNVTSISRTNQQIIISAPFGQQTVLELDGDGYCTALINPCLETNRFEYAAGGMLTNVVSRRGNPYGIVYDSTGHVEQVNFPNGQTWEFSRSDYYGSNEVFYVSGGIRTNLYLGQSTGGSRYCRSIIGPNGVGTNTATITQDEVVESKVWADGTELSITNEPDARFGYQVMNLSKATLELPSGLSLHAEAEHEVLLADTNDVLSVVAVTNRVAINGRTNTVEYDTSTRVLSLESPEGRTWSVQFDTNDRPQTVSIPGLNTISVSFDDFGRLRQLSGGIGAEERNLRFGYATNGFLRSITNTLDETWRVFSDPIGRVTNFMGPDLQPVQLRYEQSHKPAAIQPPGKPEHRFSYNQVGLVDQYTAPSVGVESNTVYTWDDMRQLTGICRPDGKVLTNRYTSRGLLVESQWPENKVEITYDEPTMRPLLIAATSGPSLALEWDGALLTNIVSGGSITGTVAFAYNNDLAISSVAFNGDAVAYGYDLDGLLTNAGAMRLSRDTLNGSLTNIVLDAIHDYRSFNGFGELQSRLATAYGTDLLSMNYAYDTVGRITSCTERVYFGETNTFSYTYDSAGRLSQTMTNGGLHATYQYDANGNRTNAVVGGVSSSGTYDDQDRLLSYGSATYQYDNHGTLTNKSDGGQTTAYQYDARGSLLGVTQGTNLISYGIDPLGRRISRTKNGTTTQRFVYQGFLSPDAELNADGSVATRFVYATRANVPNYMVQGGSTYRIITDIRGSVRLVVNADTRVIVQRMDYDEWGQVTQDTNPGFQPFGFAGGLYDPDTGLVRFGFRDYDPEVGRWIAKDPILFAGGQANLYLYCHGDPINWIDPCGREESCWHLGRKAVMDKDYWNDIDILNANSAHQKYSDILISLSFAGGSAWGSYIAEGIWLMLADVGVSISFEIVNYAIHFENTYSVDIDWVINMSDEYMDISIPDYSFSLSAMFPVKY